MGSNSKRVLLFAAKLGYQTRSFDEAANKLGVELIFVTDRCHQLDDPWGDRAIPVHFESPDAVAYTVLQAIRESGVDGILALGDRPAVAAAYVARSLGLFYNHPAAVEACRSKLRMREVFREAGLPVPWFRALSIRPTPEPSLNGVSYPCVLKPLSLSASQGVVRANVREEFLSAAGRIAHLLQSPEVQAMREGDLDRMIVEGYIPGREVAVEGLLTAGRLRVHAIFDKPDPLEGPYFEETIYVTPSRLSAAHQQAIERSCADAVRALGLSHGPIHAEFRVNEQGVWPLEIAPRPIGGLCARALRFSRHSNGQPNSDAEPISLEELLLRHSLNFQVEKADHFASGCGGPQPGRRIDRAGRQRDRGIPERRNRNAEWPDRGVSERRGDNAGRLRRNQGRSEDGGSGWKDAEWHRESVASGVMMIPVPRSGVLEKTQGADAARGVRGITSVEITARVHDYIAAWPEGSSYLGFIFARGETPEEVEDALRVAHSKLHFALTPRLPVQHPVTGRVAGG